MNHGSSKFVNDFVLYHSGEWVNFKTLFEIDLLTNYCFIGISNSDTSTNKLQKIKNKCNKLFLKDNSLITNNVVKNYVETFVSSFNGTVLIGNIHTEEILAVYSQGKLNSKLDSPDLKNDTIYRLCSLSKPFYVLGVFKLEDLYNDFSINDSIKKHIPKLNSQYEIVKIFDLITHRSILESYNYNLVEDNFDQSKITFTKNQDVIIKIMNNNNLIKTTYDKGNKPYI